MKPAVDIRCVPPEDDESLDSWISRITTANDIDRRIEITAAAGLQHANHQILATAAREGLPKLAVLIGCAAEDLERRAYAPAGEANRRTFFGTTVHENDLATTTRRFSPAGLRKDRYQKTAWQLRIPFCIDSWEMLTDRCPRPSCGAVQGWRYSIGIALCDKCAEDLTKAEVASVPTKFRVGAGRAVGLTHPDADRRQASLDRLPPEIAALGADGAFELVLRLMRVVDRDIPYSASSRFWNADPMRIAKALSEAWPLACGWPDAFRSFVSRHLVGRRDRFGDGNDGATRAFLRLASSAHLPARVRTVISRLRTSMSVEHFPDDSIVDIKEAAKITGVSPAPLAEIRRAGALITVAAYRADRLVAFLDRKEILALKDAMRDRIGLDRVATILGIPMYGVEQAAALGILPLLEHPFFVLRYRDLSTTSCRIEDLMVRLESKARARAPVGAAPILDLLKAIGGRPKPWGPLIAAMLEGSLPFAIKDERLPFMARVLVSRQDLARPAMSRFDRASFPGFRFETHMTKRDAGEILNLTPREHTRAFRHFRTTNQRIVTVTEVEALARNHVAAVELAARSGRSAKFVYSMAREAGAPYGPAGFDREIGEALILRKCLQSEQVAAVPNKVQTPPPPRIEA